MRNDVAKQRMPVANVHWEAVSKVCATLEYTLKKIVKLEFETSYCELCFLTASSSSFKCLIACSLLSPVLL